MFDPFTLALFGGAVGGLLDKKDPLRGAALGAAGGYFAPGLLGGAPQAAAPVADAAITSVGAPVAEAAITPVADIAAGETLHPFAAQMQQSLNTPAGGLLQAPAPVADAVVKPVSGMSQYLAQAKELGSTIKPYAEAAGTGVQVAGMFKQPEQAPITPSPFMQPNTPSMPMNNLVAQMQQGQQLRQQADMQRRQRRQSLIG